MSDTPETDAIDNSINVTTHKTMEAVLDFARKLERERDEARAILNGDKLSPVALMWQRCFLAEAERDQLRKVADELAMFRKDYNNNRGVAHYTGLELYNALPHVLERNRAK